MRNIKARMEYLLCLLLAVAYLVFLDGRAGMFILIAFAVAPLVSYGMLMYAKSRISFGVRMTAETLAKGQNAEIVAEFRSTSVLPTPFIQIKLYTDKHLETDTNEYKLAFAPKADRVISKKVMGVVCGEGVAGIQSVVMTDYMGLKTIVLYEEKGLAEYSARIGVLPNIPDTTLKNALIQNVSAVAASEESEEVEDMTRAVSGVPGYEHREYVPGDQIKRINWKLSSKQDKLMVRLDEGVADAKQYAVLDYVGNSSEDGIFAEEHLIEGFLAFSSILVKLGKDLVFYRTLKNSWSRMNVKNAENIYELQYDFARAKFHGKGSIGLPPRLPEELISGETKAAAVTVFTNSPDEELMAEISSLESRGTECFVVVAEPVGISAKNMWLIGDNYNFEYLN